MKLKCLIFVFFVVAGGRSKALAVLMIYYSIFYRFNSFSSNYYYFPKDEMPLSESVFVAPQRPYRGQCALAATCNSHSSSVDKHRYLYDAILGETARQFLCWCRHK